MLERMPRRVVNFFAGRIINNLVTINSYKAIDERIQELVEEGDIPIGYADHEGHGDGIAIAKVSGYLRDLTAEPRSRFHLPRWLHPRPRYCIKGLAIILAKSMVTGDQSEELKDSYDLLVDAGRKKGLEPVPVTREEDQKRYGMTREQIVAELSPLREYLLAGYGMAFLPEGSIQGGRHPKEKDIEEIYGMQEIKNNNLMTFYRLVKHAAHKRVPKKDGRPFYMPMGIYGSFRIMQSTEIPGDKPKLTRRGKWSLVAAALGIPFGVAKIEVQLLMPFTEDEIAEDLGPDWTVSDRQWRDNPEARRKVEAFNRYAMEKVLPGIPQKAWGFYGREAESAVVVQAIEIACSS